MDVTYQITPKYDTTIDGLNGKTNMTNVVVTDPLPSCATYVSSSALGTANTNANATLPQLLRSRDPHRDVDHRRCRIHLL